LGFTPSKISYTVGAAGFGAAGASFGGAGAFAGAFAGAGAGFGNYLKSILNCHGTILLPCPGFAAELCIIALGMG
jgi:hypothetical protein